MNFDDVEHLLEGVLVGLRSRKRLAELEAENKRLTTLVKEHDDLKRQLDKTTNEFTRREEKLRGDYNKLFDAVAKDFAKREEDLSLEFRLQLSEANSKIVELNDARLIAEETANFYHDSYSEMAEVYKTYQELDEATRYDLIGIFGEGDTVMGFFSGAVQEGHLAPFWDYVSRRTDSDKLRYLFDFCFESLNLGFRKPPYARLQIMSGDFFDNDTMRRTSQSSQLGKVSRVIFQGYRYSGGNVVKKTIVELG